MSPRSFVFVSVSSLVLAAFASAGVDKVPPPEPEPAAESSGPRWRLGVGVQWRSLDRISLHASPRARLSALPGLVDRAHGSAASGNGPAGAPGDRRYADGFVFQDDATATDGTTWWWGYQNPSQVEGGTLSFQSGGGYTTASAGGRAGDFSSTYDDAGGAGPVLELSADWHIRPGLTVGGAFAFSFLDVDARQRAGLLSAWQTSSAHHVTESDRYTLGGVIPPQAPYAGTQEGPGPVINNIPTQRLRHEGAGRQRQASFVSVAETSFDADVFNFSFGPTVGWHSGPVSFKAGASLDLDVVSWELRHEETLSAVSDSGRRRLAQWRDASSGTDIVPGLGLSGAVTWHITPSLDATVFAKWRAMDSLELQTGSARVELDPSGWTVGLTFGYSF